MNDQKRYYLNNLGIVSCVGAGRENTYESVFKREPKPFTPDSENVPGRTIFKGEIGADMPDVPDALSAYRCRNARITLCALEQILPDVKKAIETYGPDQVGVVMGSSTAGIAEGETAVKSHLETEKLTSTYRLVQQEMGSVSEFVAEYLGLAGPAYTVSTACSSSSKAILAARNLIATGACRAVITGGSDSLCKMTLNGFSELEAMSPDRCNPMSKNRTGILIGEGAAVFLLTGEPRGVELRGGGESSDAHHISAPQPDGLGAEAAMRSALEDAGMSPEDIIYLNMHGTATDQNDRMESRAIERVFGLDVPCSSTKPYTGHTLGAAGAIEAGLSWLVLNGASSEVLLPPHSWDGERDEELAALRLVEPGETVPHKPGNGVLSNSFAFGGSNCSLILSSLRE